MQHMPQVEAARCGERFDYRPVFAALAPRMRAADLTVVNLETTLTRRGRYTGYPLFRSPVALADALRDAGVDVAVLANNHCCDGGAEGIRTTVAELDRCGILHTGVFADSADYKKNNPLYLNRCGMRLAIVNYTYGTNGMPVPAGTIVNLIDTVRMAADLAEARASGVDFIVACLHGAMSTSVGRTPDNGVWPHFCVATASAWWSEAIRTSCSPGGPIRRMWCFTRWAIWFRTSGGVTPTEGWWLPSKPSAMPTDAWTTGLRPLPCGSRCPATASCRPRPPTRCRCPQPTASSVPTWTHWRETTYK